MIYLDYNSTCPMLPSAIERMNHLLAEPLNASSIHAQGRKAKKIINDSRIEILKSLTTQNKYDEYKVIFTSSGTEANNIILHNFKQNNIFIAATEHNSIYNVYPSDNVTLIHVNKNGILNLEELDKKLSNSDNGKQNLLCITLANNETGIIQNLKQITDITKKFHCHVHSDITQCIGKMELDISKLNIDSCTLSSHKIGGALGAAALVIKDKISLKSLFVGGYQEDGVRPGTENVPSIATFGIAAYTVQNNIKQRIHKLLQLRNMLENELKKKLPYIHIVGENTDRLCNTTMIIGKKDSHTHMIYLDLNNIYVSNGSACSSGSINPSHILKAMGYSDEECKKTIRISTGYNTTESDIKKFVSAYSHLEMI